tara:strand:- start:710 stop:943 length:234 start_codon:yes stop_codon:yes gene_type:complete
MSPLREQVENDMEPRILSENHTDDFQPHTIYYYRWDNFNVGLKIDNCRECGEPSEKDRDKIAEIMRVLNKAQGFGDD